MPNNIQGLNIVQAQPASSENQDLLSGQAFPDISAQLDLWTNLTFDSEETRNDDGYQRKSVGEEEEEETKSPNTASGEKAIHDGHDNVVTATNLGNNTLNNSQQSAATAAIDLTSFLSGFGIDPFTDLSHLSQQPQQGSITPSLAHILALHSQVPVVPSPVPPQFAHYPLQSVAGYPRIPPFVPTSHAPNPVPAPSPVTPSVTTEEPPTKRARARKLSVSSPASPEGFESTGAVAEDKRRRNTAASARFRLKKKEREAALEGKAKELETRVNELERECEGLRRENGWLKGLVVGVTGAAQGPVVTPSNLSPSQLTNLANAVSGTKRARDESNN